MSVVLESQRFSPNATLLACVADGYRITTGEPDRDAVRRLQTALHDLGYLVRGGFDGRFGGATGDAVIAFKTDEGLNPPDAVASRGTVGRLDEYFRHEPPDPDAPDPSRDGLDEVVAQAAGDAVDWITAAIDALNRVPSDELHPEDPEWLVFDERVQRIFHVEQSGLGRERALDELIIPVYLAAKRSLAPPNPFFFLSSLDRAGFSATFPAEDYIAVTERIGGRIVVTPPFRNVFPPDERAAALLRLGAGLDGRIDQFALPGTPRFARLGSLGIHNTLAYAAFAFECLTGQVGAFLPRFRWLDVT